MANNPQAKKRIRQTARRSTVNTVSRIRTFVRKVEEAIESGNKSAAEAALLAAQPELMRGAVKGVMHKSTASRKVSRLTRRVKAMA